MLIRQSSVFLADDEEFVLELSRLHRETFEENVWKSERFHNQFPGPGLKALKQPAFLHQRKIQPLNFFAAIFMGV